MRLNSSMTTEREKVLKPGTDALLSCPVAPQERGALSFLPGSLASHAKSYARLRIALKKRIRIISGDGNRIFKRALDVCGSLSAIILLLPFFLVIALWLKLDSPGPLIYRQVRVGLHGHPFYFYISAAHCRRLRPQLFGALALCARRGRRHHLLHTRLRKSRRHRSRRDRDGKSGVWGVPWIVHKWQLSQLFTNHKFKFHSPTRNSN